MDLECLLYALLRCTAADVEEVRGLATGEFDDVHCRHREPGSVDHASDVAIKLDVIEIELRRFDLERLFFVQIAKFDIVLVTKHRVVVESNFGVECDQTIVFGKQKRIDLDKRGVHLLIRVIERQHELCSLIDKIIRNAKTERELASLETTKT